MEAIVKEGKIYPSDPEKLPREGKLSMGMKTVPFMGIEKCTT